MQVPDTESSRATRLSRRHCSLSDCAHMSSWSLSSAGSDASDDETDTASGRLGCIGDLQTIAVDVGWWQQGVPRVAFKRFYPACWMPGGRQNGKFHGSIDFLLIPPHSLLRRPRFCLVIRLAASFPFSPLLEPLIEVDSASAAFIIASPPLGRLSSTLPVARRLPSAFWFMPSTATPPRSGLVAGPLSGGHGCPR